MRLAISNIAWDVDEDEAVAALLKRHGVDAIDVAPGKYFPDPARADPGEIARVRETWAERGVEITGMQSLLFGTEGLNLFGPTHVQEAMLKHLDAVCRIGAGLGGTRLVFGSPKNRDRTGLSDAAAAAAAIPFFRRLGDVAGALGLWICLEPNPARYGANFMTDSAQTAAVVEQVAHAAVRMQLDTGALAINGEAPEAVLGRCAPLIGHVHASEPDLVPLGDGGAEHARVAAALRLRLPNHVVSIEMVATRDEPHPAAIDRALGVASLYYRGAEGAGGVRWLVLILGVAANASASVMVKLAMLPPREFPSPAAPAKALTNWPFWLGLGLYGAAFLLYAAALARLPLNVAHPVLTSGAVAAVALLSVAVFREPFHWTTGAGVLLVIAGVALITARAA